MTVIELRSLVARFKDAVATMHSSLLKKQKMGFLFNEVYKQTPYIIQIIVADAIIKANDALLETDKIRLPVWIDKDSFLSFIAKLNMVCQSLH